MIGKTAITTLDPPAGVSDHARGSQTALVTLVEYGEYECARCGQAHLFAREARRRFGDRLRFVFRHFVRMGVHAHAQHAAEAAEAAGAQGRFWEMHDALFTHQEALDNGFLVEYADALGLDMSRFLRDMAGHVYADHVRQDLQSGMRSGVERTPTFFLDGVRFDSDGSEEALLAAITDLVAARQGDAGLSPQLKNDAASQP
jgi:protein-disulfide isomerase